MTDLWKRGPRPLRVTCDAGLESTLASELADLGVDSPRPEHRGVSCRGDEETLWRINLASHVANRVLVPIAEFPVRDREALYAGVQRIRWARLFRADQTLAIDATSHRSAMTHTQFINQVVKDAICDHFRAETGRRPSVDRNAPAIRVNVRLDADHCTVSLDSSGARLHRRGWRRDAGEAPIKETLAAGILLQAGWPSHTHLVDPFCGAGTFAIEAALIARGVAPGLTRLDAGGEGFAFERWQGHQPARFEQLARALHDAASSRARQSIHASDPDPDALERTRRNAARAGVTSDLRLEQASIAQLAARPAPAAHGLLVGNPPYGERLSASTGDLTALYASLGDALHGPFLTWESWLLVGEDAPWPELKRGPAVNRAMRNGALPCRLLQFAPRAPRPPRPPRHL